jgi:RNA polymerase sigma-70 factor (ECF subfamily)
MKNKGDLLLDVTLIRRTQAGDADAFAQLFEGYKNLVFHTAFLMLNSADDAEDVLQDVFIQVHRSLDSYDSSKGAFSTWMHRITVNNCLNRRRHWTFFTARLDEIPEGDLPATIISDGQRADIESIQQAISALSIKLRAVIILRFYWELSYAEISEVLDLPLGTIKSRINLALQTLQSNLKDELDLAIYSIKEEPK